MTYNYKVMRLAHNLPDRQRALPQLRRPRIEITEGTGMAKVRIATMALVVFVLFAGIFALATDCSAQGKGTPKFFVRNDQVDVGDFYEGVDVEYEFKVRNNGAAELQIINVKPG